MGAIQANVSLASIDDTLLSTYDETAGIAIVQLVHGASVDKVATSKDLTSTAGELHMVPAPTSAKGVKQLIGGVHLRKLGGDFVVSAPKIILGGGVGKFHAAW